MNQRAILNELSDILELPRLHANGESWRILNAILKTITSALQRGETVKIHGFGIFKIRTRRAHRYHAYFYPRLGKGQHGEICMLPEKQYVFFQPSKVLLRMLNE